MRKWGGSFLSLHLSYAEKEMKALVAFAEQFFHQAPTSVQTVTNGASGRCIARFHIDGSTIIGVAWTNERPDNDSFVPVAQYLKNHAVNVPSILVHKVTAPGCGLALVEDLGDSNLLSYCSEDWSSLRQRYRRAMEQVHRLHSCPVPTEFALQPDFDFDLYRWEQAYFAEHFLGTHLHISPQKFLDHSAPLHLAKSLSKLPRSLVHRDCQSQNIHIYQGHTWLIDFQGMRLGRPEYDLASLVFDAYPQLSDSCVNDLISDWQSITGSPLDSDVLTACALQRVMQMLGAFANIGYNKGNAWYLNQIPAALSHLQRLIPHSPLAECLSPLLKA